jgi:hypothetical protein
VKGSKISMSKATTLATGRVTGADDILIISYVESGEGPPVIFLRWPRHPSVTDPNRLPAVANAVMGVLGEAVGKLAAIRTDEY